MPFTLMKLPYSFDALSPVISAETVSFHYGKHHQTYVEKANAAIEGTELDGKPLVEVVRATLGQNAEVFNNAAQIWNHDFYWHSLAPDGGGEPQGALLDAITRSFGSVDRFRDEFSAAAAALFGSGWTWLVKDGDKLVIETTQNADTPVAHHRHAVLTIDVWEHAYYIDYRNARAKYIEAFWKKVNWRHAAERFG